MNIAMTAANVFKWVAWGQCKVKRIHGWNNQGAAIYIQLLEVPPVAVATAPPTGTIPTVKSFLAQANNGFDYEFDGISLSELTVGCSSTETSFTPVAAASGLDMTLEVDTVCDVRTGDTIAGDLTTGRNSLQAWADASGPKRLLRVDWLSAESVTLPSGIVVGGWLQIHCADSPANGAVAPFQSPANLDASGTIKQVLAFGDDGLVPLSGISVNTGTARENTNRGCNLYPSTTSGTLTAVTDNGTAIRAIYGAITR